MATLSNMDGIDGNIWSANTLTNGDWNWSRLPGAEYTIVLSNNTVLIYPAVGSNGWKVISIGKPGGQ